jgi:hypothetical protein
MTPISIMFGSLDLLSAPDIRLPFTSLLQPVSPTLHLNLTQVFAFHRSGF